MKNLHKALYDKYKRKIDFKISYEDFCHPKVLINLHEKLVGTVIKKYDSQLRIYDHIIYCGCMLFFIHLTEDQITNGPLVWEDQKGTAHCF